MPFCAKCGDEFSERRYELGYRTCLRHGEAKINFPVVPVSKSNYIVGNMQDLKYSYNVKGQR